MTHITFELDLDLVDWVEKNFPTTASLSEAINKAIRRKKETMVTPFDVAIEQFRKNLVNIHQDFQFEVPQVVGNTHWQPLDRSSRHAFGRHIKANQTAFGIEFVRTTTSNHAVYRKVKP